MSVRFLKYDRNSRTGKLKTYNKPEKGTTYEEKVQSGSLRENYKMLSMHRQYSNIWLLWLI